MGEERLPLHLIQAVRLLSANGLSSSPPQKGGEQRKVMPLPHYLSQLLKAVAQGFDQEMHIPSSGAHLVLTACLQSNVRAGSLPPQPQWTYQSHRRKRGQSCRITARLVNIEGWRKTGSLSSLQWRTPKTLSRRKVKEPKVHCFQYPRDCLFLSSLFKIEKLFTWALWLLFHFAFLFFLAEGLWGREKRENATTCRFFL